ncbi:hypothetical protein KW842_05835 [Duganella sp. sic0402]|uniref:TOTE conflict system archaeo-eukaryotic primase domain-containing protein n=1 Tax=Duganella sp. sic0402 TaxID=2854786 RepID=UPI001C4822BB|nr:hypothetical protein [Duganella sp. sic0402]MBV7535285.1 hypothetical protein [Duganella sp. sic0402]
MDKLISELQRLYLPSADNHQRLQHHLRGEATFAFDLAQDGVTRAIVIDFNKATDEQHWLRLCDVANALQTELGLPAPAVSVSGGECYRLWLSLASPLSVTQARQFLALLHQAYFEDEDIDLGRTMVELPPCLHVATGLWAAFINPSMGGALADDLGLEVTPNDMAQAAFLEKLDSISDEEFAHALNTLQRRHAKPAPVYKAPAPQASLLLKDATLEDIVKHLHAMGIEPTFRHVLKS